MRIVALPARRLGIAAASVCLLALAAALPAQGPPAPGCRACSKRARSG
jgi:hypothetical protein